MNNLISALRRAVPLHATSFGLLAAAGLVLGATVGLMATIGLAGPAGAVVVPIDRTRAADEPDSGAIDGVVVDVDGRPYLGAIVKLHEADESGSPDAYLRPAFTGVDGRYQIDDLPAGCYVVVVEAPAGTAFEDEASSQSNELCLGAEAPELAVRSVVTPTVSVAAPGASATHSTWSIDVVHVGQHLGRLGPSTIRLDVDGTAVDAEVGGWARVVAAIDQARPADAPESTITVHTGGVLGGSALSHLFGGAPDAAMMSHACLDYLAPSPEDRTRRTELDTLLGFLDEQPCPTTVLDADWTDGGPAGDGAVALRPVGANTVAIVAVAAEDTEDAAAATARRVDDLIDDGITAIVLLSGLGLEADRELAATLPEVDAIVGGGPDSLLGDLEDLGLATAGPYPAKVDNADGDPVCLGHAGHDANAIGLLAVGFDDDGRAVDCGGQIQLLLGRHLGPGDGGSTLAVEDRAMVEREVVNRPELTTIDPDLEATVALARWMGALDVRFDDPVATVTEDLCHTSVPSRSVGILCGPGDRVVDTTGPRDDVQGLVADAFRHRIEHGGGSDGSTPVVAVVASHSVGAAIEPGPLTIVDAYRLLPAEPSLVVVGLSGSDLITTLEEGIAGALAGDVGPDNDGSDGANPYPHISGLRWKPDLSRPAGSRTGPVEVPTSDGAGWQPIDPDGHYLVVTTDDLVADGSAYPTLVAAAADGQARTTAIGGAEALVDYVDDELGGLISAS